MDDEHGAFWVSVFTDDEIIIEVNNDLSLAVMMDGEETNYQATNWNEVADLYKLLLQSGFEEIMRRVK